MRIRRALTPALLSCALVLTGCASDGGQEDETDKPGSASTTTDPSSPSTEPTAGTTAAGAGAKPATGRSFSGKGYTFKAPEGWTDATRQAKDLNSLVEVAAAASPDDSGFATNMNVVVADSGVDEPNAELLRQVSDAIKKRLSDLVPELRVNAQTEISGKPALHHQGAATKSGVEYYIDQYVAFDDGKAFTITFSFGRDKTADQRAAVVGPVLAGWAWE